jgi:3-hydroxybutyryl-CoA dehydrogenase
MGDIKKAGVLGAGMMGAEIALCFAMAGIDVTIRDVTTDLAKKGIDNAGKALDRLAKKGIFDAAKKDATLAIMHPTDSLNAFADADFVVEAIFEDLKLKQDTFAALDKIAKPSCIFSSNTSSLKVTAMAAAVGEDRRGLFLGTHFFSPVSIMKLVEVVHGLETSNETVEITMELMRKIGKTPIKTKDVAGFAVNRMLHAMWIEAERCVDEGVATPEDLDIGCKLGLGHPVGPFQLMDLVTNSLTLNIQRILQEAYGERFMPGNCLTQRVDAGHLGRSCGRGWYDYRKK